MIQPILVTHRLSPIVHSSNNLPQELFRTLSTIIHQKYLVIYSNCLGFWIEEASTCSHVIFPLTCLSLVSQQASAFLRVSTCKACSDKGKGSVLLRWLRASTKRALQGIWVAHWSGRPHERPRRWSPARIEGAPSSRDLRPATCTEGRHRGSPAPCFQNPPARHGIWSKHLAFVSGSCPLCPRLTPAAPA